MYMALYSEKIQIVLTNHWLTKHQFFVEKDDGVAFLEALNPSTTKDAILVDLSNLWVKWVP